MKTYLFVGGPMHGEVRDLPEANPWFSALVQPEITWPEWDDDPSTPLIPRAVLYNLQKVVLFKRTMSMYVLETLTGHERDRLAADLLLSDLAKGLAQEDLR